MNEQHEMFAWIDFVKDNLDRAEDGDLVLLDFLNAWSVDHDTQNLSYKLGFDWLSIDTRRTRVHLTLVKSDNSAQHLGDFNSIGDAQIAAFIFINQ